MLGFLTLIAGAVVLFLPGLAWLGLFWDPDQDLFEQLAVAAGVSISLTALVGLATFLGSLQLTTIALLGIYLILLPQAVLVLIRIYLSFAPWGRREQDSRSQAPYGREEQDSRISVPPNYFLRNYFSRNYALLHYFLISVLFLAVLGMRFFQARDLVLPAWVDSVHHVLIVRLILENKSLPASFLPYMPVPFYYHFAFHTVAAAYTALARLEAYLGVLQLGQALNALVVLAVYRLGMALWSDWRRAALSALVVGFVTQMPAYYVSWGRYTLLTGMVLLPLAMAAALDLARKGSTLPRFATLCVLTAGLLLAHYYAALLFAIFLLILCFQEIVRNYRSGRILHQATWLPIAGAALLGLGLVGTWVARTIVFTRGNVEIGVLPPSLTAVEEFYFPNYLSYLWRLLGPLRNQVLTLAALPGLAILIQRKSTRALGVWSAFLVVSTLPWGIYLSPFRPDHAAIVLFLPVALQIADIGASLAEWRNEARFGKLKAIAIVISIACLVGWGAWQTRSIINPGTVLATRADLQAIEWIERETPPEARFFINVNHWQYGIYRGSDGGWWITPISGRETLLPPALYPMGPPSYVEQVNTLAAAASQINGCTQELRELARSAGLTHIYVKEGQGSLQPEALQACPMVEMLYSREGVFIYQILN